VAAAVVVAVVVEIAVVVHRSVCSLLCLNCSTHILERLGRGRCFCSLPCLRCYITRMANLVSFVLSLIAL